MATKPPTSCCLFRLGIPCSTDPVEPHNEVRTPPSLGFSSDPAGAGWGLQRKSRFWFQPIFKSIGVGTITTTGCVCDPKSGIILLGASLLSWDTTVPMWPSQLSLEYQVQKYDNISRDWKLGDVPYLPDFFCFIIVVSLLGDYHYHIFRAHPRILAKMNCAAATGDRIRRLILSEEWYGIIWNYMELYGIIWKNVCMYIYIYMIYIYIYIWYIHIYIYIPWKQHQWVSSQWCFFWGGG